MAWGLQSGTTKRSREFSAQRMVYQRRSSGCEVETGNRPVGRRGPARKPIDKRFRINRSPAMEPMNAFLSLHLPPRPVTVPSVAGKLAKSSRVRQLVSTRFVELCRVQLASSVELVPERHMISSSQSNCCVPSN